METISRSRQYPVSAARLEAAMLADVPAFLRVAGYDDVTVTDEGVVVERRLGMARLEMTLRIEDGAPETLAVTQADGHFESMTTTYDVTADDGGAVLTATTEFELDDVVGAALKPELVRRRRGEEFDAQFDYLETAVEAEASR
jgi:hypothetical protein